MHISLDSIELNWSLVSTIDIYSWTIFSQYILSSIIYQLQAYSIVYSNSRHIIINILYIAYVLCHYIYLSHISIDYRITFCSGQHISHLQYDGIIYAPDIYQTSYSVIYNSIFTVLFACYIYFNIIRRPRSISKLHGILVPALYCTALFLTRPILPRKIASWLQLPCSFQLNRYSMPIAIALTYSHGITLMRITVWEFFSRYGLIPPKPRWLHGTFFDTREYLPCIRESAKCFRKTKITNFQCMAWCVLICAIISHIVYAYHVSYYIFSYVSVV
jgi:hypothetical protein